MFSDVVTERIAMVRRRFAANLDEYLDEITSPLLPGGETGLSILAQAYQRAHKLCGVGPILGFVATGKRARAIERLLRPAVKARRPLNSEEIQLLRERIAQLRSVAAAEIDHPAPRENGSALQHSA
ncbi:MAG: Hpt domain-containing protein [Xanthobacteraceae bacterium]